MVELVRENIKTEHKIFFFIFEKNGIRETTQTVTWQPVMMSSDWSLCSFSDSLYVERAASITWLGYDQKFNDLALISVVRLKILDKNSLSW